MLCEESNCDFKKISHSFSLRRCTVTTLSGRVAVRRNSKVIDLDYSHFRLTYY